GSVGGGRLARILRLRHDLWFRLGFRLGFWLGLRRRRLCNRLSLFLLIGRLIALDQFLRYPLRYAWRSLWEHWLSLARQSLLRVEKIIVQHAGRIKTLTAADEDAKRQREKGQASAREAIHAATSTAARAGAYGHQHLDARTGGGRRLCIRHDQVEPAFGRGPIAGAPRGEDQELACGVTERAIIGCERLKPPLRLLIGAGVDQERAGAQ